MRWLLLLLSVAALGCPSSRPPDEQPASTSTPTTQVDPVASASASGPPQAVTSVGWSVHVTSDAAGLNPDTFDTPDKRAKIFFDHVATGAEGKVTVEHKTLSKSWPMKDDAKAASFDELMRTTDWSALVDKLSKEGGSEGGTVFKFDIALGDAKHSLSTADLDANPALLNIVKTLKETAGVP